MKSAVNSYLNSWGTEKDLNLPNLCTFVSANQEAALVMLSIDWDFMYKTWIQAPKSEEKINNIIIVNVSKTEIFGYFFNLKREILKKNFVWKSCFCVYI